VSGYDVHFRKYSKRYFGAGYDWRVFKAQAIAESRLDSAALSRAGARGIMQLLPSTFSEIRSHNPDLESIDDPRSNIAAGIHHDRRLWRLWSDHDSEIERQRFMFASYNAGRGTILRAQAAARRRQLDERVWRDIESVAPAVTGWRYRETFSYLRTIEGMVGRMDPRGRLRPRN